jgi:hypothetical protein
VHLGFNVLRLNSLPHYVPLVERALREGLTATLLCDHTETETPRAGGKSYEFPWVEQVPAFRHGRPHVVPYRTPAEFAEIVKRSGVDVVVSIWKHAALTALRRQYAPSVPIVQLQDGWDFLVAGMDLDVFDVVYGLARDWGAWLEAYLVRSGRSAPDAARSLRARLEPRFVPVGLSRAEQLASIDRAGARARLGLPPEGPVVAVMPFPFESARSGAWSRASAQRRVWARWVWGQPRLVGAAAVLAAGRADLWPHVRHGWNDRRLVEVLHAFCRRAGATLVVKSRRKNPVRRYLRAVADRVLYDETYAPATIFDVLAAADLCVTFYSSVIAEAVHAGTPTVCLAPTREEWPAYGERMVVPALSDEPGSLYNFPGAVLRLRPGEAIERFATARLADFPRDPAARRAYLRTFFAHDDLDVSARVLADLRARFGP